ncbi:hypothetical protein DVH24_040626 [Malus domestica]|uniref:Uncharacterized protein n=1 Tax=Malus domestica TaxID=3750 RepID=A0A498I980_MALDO|nr:hypothetical protein DVH24_040626 [Malus domestica]
MSSFLILSFLVWPYSVRAALARATTRGTGCGTGPDCPREEV